MLQPIVRSAARTFRPMQLADFHATAFRSSNSVFHTKELEQTYHPRGYENSIGYCRARKPYLIRNTIAFLLLSSFIGGVYIYSIMMVEQDDFSDLESFRVLPSEEQPAPLPAKDTVTKSFNNIASLKPNDNHVTEATQSVWQRLSSFLRPASSGSSAAPSSTDASLGPVMNKKAI